MEILLLILVLIVVFFIVEFNTFMLLKNKVRQSESSIDVYLNKRFDLIPNLVETVKAYAKHEENVFSKVAEMRNTYNQKKDKKLSDSYTLNSEFMNLFGVAERMPELSSNKNFLELQNTLVKLESELQAARRIYNGNVTLYNTKLNTFPGNIIGAIIGLKPYDLFEIEEYKRKNPMEM